MSEGRFERSRYQASYGATPIHPIRVQPETIAATATGTGVSNDPPVSGVENPISAEVSGSRRRKGLHARTISIQVTGAPPAGYSLGSITRIPCLTPDFYAAASAPGTEISYLGTTWETVGFTPEVAR